MEIEKPVGTFLLAHDWDSYSLFAKPNVIQSGIPSERINKTVGGFHPPIVGFANVCCYSEELTLQAIISTGTHSLVIQKDVAKGDFLYHFGTTIVKLGYDSMFSHFGILLVIYTSNQQYAGCRPG